MAGFAELMQDVRADAAHRHQQRRAAFMGATSGGGGGGGGVGGGNRGAGGEAAAPASDVEYEPPVAIRMRPLSHARKLWANAAGAATSSRLGMNADGKRVEFVTEPKTGLKLPGEERTFPPSA